MAVVALMHGGYQLAAQENFALYRRLAVDLSQRAAELHEDETARRELAQRAADIDPSLGDPRVMLAQLLENNQDAQRQRERLLLQALAGDFVVLSRRDAVGDLAELLLQQNRSQEALRLLESELMVGGVVPLSRIMDYGERMDQSGGALQRAQHLNRLDRLYIEALTDGDAPWLSGGLIQRLRSRFPMDHELAAMDWRRGAHVSLAALEWVDAVEQLAGHASTELYRELLRSEPPQSLVPALLDRYHRSGGEDPLVHALAALDGFHEFPVEEELLADKLIWELFYERLDRSDLPEALEEAMAEMRRRDRTVLTRDDDRNGFWEERYTYHGEDLWLWQSDADQDGRASIAMSVQGEAARIAVVQAGEAAIIVVEFSSYPLVSRVRWVEAVGGSEWIPAQPIPVDVGLSRVFGAEQWNVLGRRVTVQFNFFERFDRQRRGDDSRALTADDIGEIRNDLQEWGLIE